MYYLQTNTIPCLGMHLDVIKVLRWRGNRVWIVVLTSGEEEGKL